MQKVGRFPLNGLERFGPLRKTVRRHTEVLPAKWEGCPQENAQRPCDAVRGTASHGKRGRRLTEHGARMGAQVLLYQLARLHMGVYLRRGNARMPEHLLNRAQVGPALEQVGRKGMS